MDNRILGVETVLTALCSLLGFFTLFGSFQSAVAQDWIQSTAPPLNWITVASSADGTRAVVAPVIGQVYTSTNAGATWAATTAPSIVWHSVASSADGTRLAALPGLEPSVYLSTNGGATWRASGVPNAGQNAVAMSADGMKLLIAGNGVSISSDFGVTWTNSPLAPGNYVLWVACSADGTKLVAEAQGPYSPVYISTNSGGTWLATGATNDYPGGVAISADGSTLIAASYTFDVGGPIYVSTNCGATWIRTSAPNDYWTSVTCSADGTRMAAFGNGVYLSLDSGLKWSLSGGRTGAVSDLASSADGCRLVLESQLAGIFTYRAIPTPLLRIAPFSGNVVLSWLIPSMPFLLQEADTLVTPNWADVTNAPVLNYSTLRNEVTISAANGVRFYRLKAQ